MSQYLPKKPGAIPLIAALAANSHFLYANIGVMTAGMVPYILNQSSPPHPREVAKSMNWFIETAKNTFVGTALSSSAFFGYTAFSASSEPRIQQLSAVAAVSMLVVLPYTVAFMLPLNSKLKAMDQEGREGKAVVEKVRTWRRRHAIRMVLGTIAWVAGILALEIL